MNYRVYDGDNASYNSKKIRYIGIAAFLMEIIMKGFFSVLLYFKLESYASDYFLGTGTFLHHKCNGIAFICYSVYYRQL